MLRCEQTHRFLFALTWERAEIDELRRFEGAENVFYVQKSTDVSFIEKFFVLKFKALKKIPLSINLCKMLHDVNNFAKKAISVLASGCKIILCSLTEPLFAC